MVFNENHQFLLKGSNFQHKFHGFHRKAEALFKGVVKDVAAVIACCAVDQIYGFYVAEVFFDKVEKIICGTACFNAFVVGELVAVQKCVEAEFIDIHKKLPFDGLDKKVFPMYNNFGRTFLSVVDNASCNLVGGSLR